MNSVIAVWAAAAATAGGILRIGEIVAHEAARWRAVKRSPGVPLAGHGRSATAGGPEEAPADAATMVPSAGPAQ
jgi:hypothetical protein